MALIIIFLGIAATIYYFYAMASIRKKLPNDYKGILSDSSSPTFAILLIIAVILSMGFLASEKWIERSHILPFVLTIAIMILVFRRIYLYQRFKKIKFPHYLFKSDVHKYYCSDFRVINDCVGRLLNTNF